MSETGRHYPLEETVDQALEDCDSPDSLRQAVAAELARRTQNSERWEWVVKLLKWNTFEGGWGFTDWNNQDNNGYPMRTSTEFVDAAIEAKKAKDKPSVSFVEISAAELARMRHIEKLYNDIRVGDFARLRKNSERWEWFTRKAEKKKFIAMKPYIYFECGPEPLTEAVDAAIAAEKGAGDA